MAANMEGNRFGLEIIRMSLKIFRQERPCQRTFGIEVKMAAA
jgi:hypothetical protein